MPKRPPLHETELPELCARVATALLRRSYVILQDPEITLHRIILYTLAGLPAAGYPIVRTALAAIEYACTVEHLTVAQWSTRVWQYAAMGCGFRRCYFGEYKANRRADPHVINKGVKPSRKRHGR